MKQKSSRRSTAGVKVFITSASLAVTFGGWAALSVANAGQLQASANDAPAINDHASGFGQSPFNFNDDSGGQSPSDPSLNQPQLNNPNVQQVAPNQFNNSYPQPFRRTHSSR
jgi:hypothetical protein